jgi:hypothetical protein
MIAVVVVVGRVGVNGRVGAVQLECGRLWWTPVAGGRGNWSWFERRRRDGGRSWVELPSPFPFDMDGSCRC